MKKTITLIAMALLVSTMAIAQTTEAEAALKKEKQDLPDGWQKGGLFSIGFNQLSLTNWAAGGQNSLSGNSLINLFADYKKESLT